VFDDHEAERFGARGTGVVGRGQAGEVATGFERLVADASDERDLVEAGVPAARQRCDGGGVPAARFAPAAVAVGCAAAVDPPARRRCLDPESAASCPYCRRRAAPVFVNCTAVSAAEIDEYLVDVDEPKRSTLQGLRRTILEIVPKAEQVISYRVPAFRVQGKVVAGFAAFKDHLSYLPFSGSVLDRLGDELSGYTMTKSALHFPVDRPLAKRLVKNLIAVRLDEKRQTSR
jgi:uncharacterized protein YdhG (YjbR/CyaY superfamily)